MQIDLRLIIAPNSEAKLRQDAPGFKKSPSEDENGTNPLLEQPRNQFTAHAIKTTVYDP